MNFDKLIVLKDEKIALTEKLLKRLKEQKDALIAEIDSEKFFQKKQLDEINDKIEVEMGNS